MNHKAGEITDCGGAVTVDSTPDLGVNVAGYLTAELGVGEAARGYVASLQSLGIPTSLTDFTAGTASRKNDTSLSNFTTDNPHPINLICINADQIPAFIAHVKLSYFEQKYNIGVWWWELPTFPKAWHSMLNCFNEIWVGSSFAYHSISKYASIPVIKVPPVVQTHLQQNYTKSSLGLDASEFVFLFVFDFLSSFERKNPLAVVNAFKQAFQADEPVRLVLKCINQNRDSKNFNRLKAAIKDPRITVIDRYLSRDEKNGLISVCDCYISLHRAEGFGLTLAEAMLFEKPVIATGWSGNMDFMTVNNSYPVEYQLVTLERDYGPYQQGQTWAEPSLDHASQLMHHVYTQPEEAIRKAKRAAVDIRQMHSPAAVGEMVKARLDLVNNRNLSPIGKLLFDENHWTFTALNQARSQIEAMESSKFWQLRTQWLKLKRLAGLEG